MLTDDPGTPGDGHWEINFAATARHTASGSEAEIPLLDINYGIGERIQLKYEIPWVTLHEEDDGSRSGLGNSLLGVKWRFYDSEKTGWQISTYPQVEVRNPGSSSAERGLVQDGTSVLLPCEFQRDFAAAAVNFEVGREFVSNESDMWFGGIVIGREWRDTLEWMVELHAESSESLENSALAVNFGARVAWPGRGTFLLSLGRDLHNTLEERASIFGYLGWQLTL